MRTHATLDQPFTDLELFQMFTIDRGVAALGEVKHLRNQGKRSEAKQIAKIARKHLGQGRELWYENQKQRNGTVENLDASKTIDTPEQRAARVEALRIFYANAQEGETPFEEKESDHVAISTD